MNYVDFGMNLEEALYAASVHSVRFPSYFYTAPWCWCGRSYESLMTACLNLASVIISSIFAGNGEKVREVDGLPGGGYLFGQLNGIMKMQYGHGGRHDYVPGKQMLSKLYRVKDYLLKYKNLILRLSVKFLQSVGVRQLHQGVGITCLPNVE